MTVSKTGRCCLSSDRFASWSTLHGISLGSSLRISFVYWNRNRDNAYQCLRRIGLGKIHTSPTFGLEPRATQARIQAGFAYVVL